MIFSDKSGGTLRDRTGNLAVMLATMTFVTITVCGLDYIFTLKIGCSVFSLYTFLFSKAWLGITIAKGFTEFTEYQYKITSIPALNVSYLFRYAIFLKHSLKPLALTNWARAPYVHYHLIQLKVKNQSQNGHSWYADTTLSLTREILQTKVKSSLLKSPTYSLIFSSMIG